MLYASPPTVFGMDNYPVEHRRQIVEYLLCVPRLYLVEVTLSAGASTVFTIDGLMSEFEVLLTPKDAAAAALTGVYPVVTKDTVTINHSVGAAGTEKFTMLVAGTRVRSL